MAVGFGNFGFGGQNKWKTVSNAPASDPFAGGKPSYEQWAGYESNRLGTSNPAAINPEQYQLAQYRNQQLQRAMTDSGIDLAAQGRAAAQVADPWASQRPQYQASLSQLMNNPGYAMQQNPFFKWQQQMGEQAVNRAAAARGQLGSGNRMMALSDYAQKQSGQNFFTLADLLSGLAGAKNQNPAAAAELMYGGASGAANLAKGFRAGGGGASTDINMSNFRPSYLL